MKVKYTIEFTQDQKIADRIYNGDGIDGIKSFNLYDFEKAIDEYVSIQNQGNRKCTPVLWSRFWVTLVDDEDEVATDSKSNIICEQCITSMPYIETDCQLLEKVRNYDDIFKKHDYFWNLSSEDKKSVEEWVERKHNRH